LHRPDYLICPDFVSPILSFNTKKLTVIHDSLFWDYPKNYSSIWRKYFLTLINLGIDNKTQVITTSNYSKKNLLKVINKTTLIDYVYQSFENVLDSKNNLESKLQLPESYILHIGSFEKRKDLITLVKAFHVIKKQESNKKIKLVLAGAQVVNGNKKIIKQINRYILSNDLENEVILPNYITKEDAHRYYKNALMYVFPSIDEGFGIPIIESFSYSLPVICSDTPIFKEIGNDSVSYFKKGDSISLSEKIQILINSEDLRKEFSKKGKSQLNKFSRKKFIKGFEDLIID
jgi:glycosyltransferase involved in cell wall biosynthesis